MGTVYNNIDSDYLTYKSFRSDWYYRTSSGATDSKCDDAAMTIKYIKIVESDSGQQVTVAKTAARKNIKTIIRKPPYKGGLCYRHKKNK